MSTRVESSRNFINQESVQFLRPQTITLTLIEARPSTKMYVFFGDEDVTYLCNLQGNAQGTDLITDSIGQAVIELHVPGGTLNVGTYDIIVTDTNDLGNLDVDGSVFGSARGVFSSTGTVDIFQTTETTITQVTRTRTIQRDPLAQSFFTFGVEGGIFLSSIDIFFQSKDPTIPIRCELRELENGFPSPVEPDKPELISILTPDEIQTSNDASVSSKFVFDPPVFLREEGNYCFVLKCNSINYNVFTSRLGEVSIEDGRTIFEQPYVGSLFKSENDVTWTAEQFEDIKFKINKAVFDTGLSGRVEFAATVPALGALGTSFSTVSGSNVVTYRHPQQHGLEPGSKINIVTNVGIPGTSPSILNGIPYAEFEGTFDVISTPDRNTLTFQVNSNATSTGKLESGNTVTHVTVVSQGINYSENDSVSFSGGGGTGAIATLNVVNGQIKSINMVTGGSGYTTSPTATIVSSTGTGAVIIPTVLPTFTVYVNKPMTGFIPKLSVVNFGDTRTNNVLTTTIGNYEGGNLVTYTPGKSINFVPHYPYVNMGQNSIIASSYNEEDAMNGANSSKIVIDMISDNPNLSPVIDLANRPNLHAYYHVINNQNGEERSSTNPTGSINSINVTSAGSGYTTAPTITIDPPDLPDGVQATATATLSGNSISEIEVDEAGSGYTSIPLVVVTPASDDTTGGGGAAKANLNEFNTELLPTGGSAKARYVTKRFPLQIVSTGMRLFSVISSLPGTCVDWYIRTSLSTSGVDHESQPWQYMGCNDSRQRSSYIGEFFEYEFKIDGISEFDTYDLKCVLLAQDPTRSPIVKSFRSIALA